MGPYNVTKHAVVALSETLYKDLQLTASPVGVSVLCPGFVRTGIARSARNRPSWAPAPEGDRTADVVGQLVDQGIDPSVVGEAVAAAVRANTFYIVTHPETDPMVRGRMTEILERRSPSVIPVG